ncbi:MAG: VWA domain-containing protein [bacterium]|nr:VWA domain-containing protein [bacterium]
MNSKPITYIRYGTFVLFFFLGISCSSSYSHPEQVQQTNQKEIESNKQKIMLALLLDTSNSMDGLIDQAKSQLWTIVNELAAAKSEDGERPDVEIALFEYGNDGLPSSEGYIRMVTNLTTDLDEISENLFKLTTNGGDEYCGQVIKKSIDKLDWSESKADLKMIFIAGNEPFTQGKVAYTTACSLAKDNDIVVNTIFCGNHDEGISTSWKKGATLTGGSYMSIEQDRKTVYVKTPYDDKIDKLNDDLNKTYIYYGSQGRSKKEMQMLQDSNAESYSQANKVKRAISKSSHVYKNSSWDLVDAAKDDDKAIEEADERYLPEEMKGMTTAQRKAYVTTQATKRKLLQKEILELSTKRKQYITENQPVDNEGMLDDAMINSIKEVAATKQLIFD